MIQTYLSLIKFIEQISNELNEAYHINPAIRIVFGEANKNDVMGWCTVLYKQEAMYIEIAIPWVQPCTPMAMDLLTCLLTHEYAHYIWSLKLSPAERVKDSTRYMEDTTFRRNDEYRTWFHTRKMLQDLGYWKRPSIKKACSTFLYSWSVNSVLKGI